MPQTDLEPSDVQQGTLPPENSRNHPTIGSATSSAVECSVRDPVSSQDPIIRPRSPPLASSVGRQLHSGKLVALELQPKPNKSGRPPGESPKRAQWVLGANKMLEEVPSARQWRNKISKMNSSMTAAITIDMASVPARAVSLRDDVEPKGLVQLVQRFAQRHSAGRIEFQQFILVCLCNVLSSQGTPKNKIIETLQICISDTGKANIDRYLKGVIWANTLMSDLFFVGWRYRAIELIAICKILKVFYWIFD